MPVRDPDSSGPAGTAKSGRMASWKPYSIALGRGQSTMWSLGQASRNLGQCPKRKNEREGKGRKREERGKGNGRKREGKDTQQVQSCHAWIWQAQIAHIWSNVPILTAQEMPSPSLIAEDGTQCSTRLLREQKGWMGLLLDGGYE